MLASSTRKSILTSQSIKLALLVVIVLGTVALAAVSPGRAAPVTVGTHDANALFADWRWIGVLRRPRPCAVPAGVHA